MNWFKEEIGKQTRLSSRGKCDLDSSGFTLIEALVVVIIIGVLAAIAAPSWLRFVNQRRVNATKDALLQAIQEAQNKAQGEKVPYSVSFRSQDGIPQVAVHPASFLYDDAGERLASPEDLGSYWAAGDLGSEVGLKPNQVLLVTNLDAGESNTIRTAGMTALSGTTRPADVSSITFDYTGALWNADEITGLGDGDPETDAFSIVAAQPKGQGSTDPVLSSMRCVMVRTLLGGLVSGRREYDARNNPNGCPEDR